MRTIMKVAIWVTLSASFAFAQQPTFHDQLLDHLAGDWVLQGTIAGKKPPTMSRPSGFWSINIYESMKSPATRTVRASPGTRPWYLLVGTRPHPNM